MRTATVMLIALLAGSACSGSGAAPSPSPSAAANVAGRWLGSVSFTAGGVAADETLEMTLVQASGSAAVSGSYAANRFAGNLTGQTTATSFTGTFEFNSNAQGQICTGTFSVTGRAVGSTLTWTSPSIVGSACTNTPIDIVIEVQRQ